jgi:hypothetical protein
MKAPRFDGRGAPNGIDCATSRGTGKMKMKIVDKPLKRLSICTCGHPVLNESFGLGYVYTIDLGTIRKGGYNFFCGGCKTWIKDITVVDATQSSRIGMAPLPLALFIMEGDEPVTNDQNN